MARARYGYSFVSDKGYVAFLRELSEGAWANVSIEAYDAANQMPSELLLDAPRAVVWKLRATWAIRVLAEVLGGEGILAKRDTDWDKTQRRLFHHLSAAAEDNDPAVQQAAGRLSAVLLTAGGTAHTGWRYDDEVDFGRHQLELLRQPALAADAKKVKLGSLVKDIEETTEALAEALGRGKGEKRPAARSIQLREAMTACNVTFSAIHGDLDWTIEHTPAGEGRMLPEQLRAPFLALLERFPPPAGTAGDTATEGEPSPATGTTPTEGGGG